MFFIALSLESTSNSLKSVRTIHGYPEEGLPSTVNEVVKVSPLSKSSKAGKVKV